VFIDFFFLFVHEWCCHFTEIMPNFGFQAAMIWYEQPWVHILSYYILCKSGFVGKMFITQMMCICCLWWSIQLKKGTSYLNYHYHWKGTFIFFKNSMLHNPFTFALNPRTLQENNINISIGSYNFVNFSFSRK